MRLWPFGREAKRGATGPWGASHVIPPPSMAGVLQNYQDPLANDAAWRCVNLLAMSVGMLPVKAYRLDPSGVKRPLDSQPGLLAQPSVDALVDEWVEMLMRDLTMYGNAFGLITDRDVAGYPTSIDLQSPDLVRVDKQPGKLPMYTINGVRVPREDIWHLRAFRRSGLPMGLSPIQVHAQSIGINLAAQKFGYSYFNDGHIPSSLLLSDKPLTQEQADQAKGRFMQATRGREPAVLGAGWTWQGISVKPEESQFLQTQKYGVSAIARIFGVPPEMIGGESGGSMTYSNVEQQSINFLTFSLQPWLNRLETALSRLLPGKQFVKFDTSELLRTDAETQAKVHAIGIAAHYLLPDEARQRQDLPPLTAAQKQELAMIPLTVTPVGTPKALSGAPAAGVNDPSTDPAQQAEENPA